MKLPAHRRHDITDNPWKLLEAHLPGTKGSVGRPASNNRLFINVVFWILRTVCRSESLLLRVPELIAQKQLR